MTANFAAALLDEAVALHQRGAVAEAAARYAEVLRQDPRNVDALALSALAALQQRRYDESIDLAARALRLETRHTFARHTRGGAFIALGHYAKALRDLDRVVAAEPRNGKAHADRGVALYGLDRIDEAVAAFEQGQQLAPEDHDVAFNLANVELLRGRWRSGFERYERRIALKPAAYPPLPFPLWQGEPLGDATLLLQAEQGFGDTILFARFAAHFAEEEFRVVLLVGPKIKGLMMTVPGVRVITNLEEIDQTGPIRWQRLMSLPALLGVRPNMIPGAVPYLGAEPERIAHWRGRIGQHGFKIGIAWTGSATATAILRNRFMPLEAFASIAGIPGVRLISLQKGADSETAAASFPVETLGADFDAGPDAFVDTAAVMQSLDLMVICDSALGHLAGALGRRTFVALPRPPFWPWLLDREDTPWYPSTRLFRQTRPGDWADVFRRLAAAVRVAAGASS